MPNLVRLRQPHFSSNRHFLLHLARAYAMCVAGSCSPRPFPRISGTGGIGMSAFPHSASQPSHMPSLSQRRRRRIFCPSRAPTTSSSTSATRARLRISIAPPSACRWWPMPDRKPASAIAPPTSCSRARSASCSPRRCAAAIPSPITFTAMATACASSRCGWTTRAAPGARPPAAAPSAWPSPTSCPTSTATVVLSSIRAYGDTIHTFVERGDYCGPFLPGFRAVEQRSRRAPRRPAAHRPHGGQRGLARDERVGRFLRAT